MGYKTFLTGAAIGGICYLTIEEFKKIRSQNRTRKLLWQLKEALDKSIEKSHIHEVTLSLQVLEDEIKASQNEKMLQLHDTLAKNTVDMVKFNLKE